MNMVMVYLPQEEQLSLQGLDTWWYAIGVCRVQVRLDLMPDTFYFADDRPYIEAVSESRGECKRVKSRGESSSFTNSGWVSCQVGRTHLFQVKSESGYRTLKID